jgi:hypothetical protein
MFLIIKKTIITSDIDSIFDGIFGHDGKSLVHDNIYMQKEVDKSDLIESKANNLVIINAFTYEYFDPNKNQWIKITFK